MNKYIGIYINSTCYISSVRICKSEPSDKKVFPINSRFGYIIILILIIYSIGCQPIPNVKPIEKDGKLYGVTRGLFRHRWWNYYERGISFSDGDFWKEAEADFRAALKQWDGDKRRIRTFGRHLTDYFPHRELGIVLFHQQEYKEAIRELEISLSTEKTGRAEFYLDKARKLWIENENLDMNPPAILIESLPIETISNDFIVKVAGTATDDTFVKEIRINNKPIRVDVSASQIYFQTDVPIDIGQNDIIVEVKDLTGKTTRFIEKILCDRIGPALNIDEFLSLNNSGNYVIRGYAYDDSGIREIRVNETVILKEPVREVVLNHPIVLSGTPEKAVVIAEDKAGNQTRAEISRSQAPDWGRGKYPLDKWGYGGKKNLFAFLDSDWRYYAQNKGIMTPEKKIRKYENLGDYYALIIGVNAYQEWQPLKNAVHDALALKEILISRYGFSEKNIILRIDREATWNTLIHDLKHTAGGLNETDNLLIYFSGHGQLDSISGDGYWIPVDGKLKDATTWITNSAIRNIFCSQDVKGKNIMIIADSCYSGTLLRGSSDTSQNRFWKQEKMIHGKDTPDSILRGEPLSDFTSGDYQDRILSLAYRKSRQVISSGGMEPVIDTDKKGDNHSLFAYYFLKALGENDRKVIDMEYLFHNQIWGAVAEKGGQRPVFGRLRTNTDEDGQFVFVLKSDTLKREKTEDRRNESVSVDAGRIFYDREIKSLDATPPVIEIRNWKESRTVFIKEAFLELNVHDESGIQKVIINGKNILNRPGRNLYLNYLTALNEGDNLFLIESVDQVGNRTEKSLHIHRKIRKIYETGSRMSVVLFPLSVEGLNFESENIPLDRFVQRHFSEHLTASKRFNMKEPLVQIQPDNQDDALRLAKEINAEFVLKGAIAIGKKRLEFSACMIEAQTSQVLIHQDVYGENIDKEQIKKMCQGLVVKLCDALPLIEGEIVKIKRESIIVNLGKTDQIRQGMHLIFFEEGEMIQDGTGKILGTDTEELGTGRISRLSDKISYTELFDKKTLTLLSVGQKLVTK